MHLLLLAQTQRLVLVIWGNFEVLPCILKLSPSATQLLLSATCIFLHLKSLLGWSGSQLRILSHLIQVSIDSYYLHHIQTSSLHNLPLSLPFRKQIPDNSFRSFSWFWVFCFLIHHFGPATQVSFPIRR